MNIKIYRVLTPMIIMLAGCTSMPESLNDMELKKIPSIEYLIDEVIGFRNTEIEYRPFLTFPSDKEILKPALYLKDYCAYLGGEIHQSALKMPNLTRTNPQFDSSYPGYVFNDIVESFGRFECKEETNGFVVDITHGHSSYVDDSARKTKVSIKIIPNEQLLNEVLENQKNRQLALKALNDRQKKRELKLLTAKLLFVEGQKGKLLIGQRICSIKNQLGFVENIANQKIKVLLDGEAKHKKDYALFSDGVISISKPSQSYIWDDKRNWSKCKGQFID